MTPFRWGSICNPASWVDCPELISCGTADLVRCAVPAQILRRDQLPGATGLAVPHIQTRCVLGHVLLLPAEMLNSRPPVTWRQGVPETGGVHFDRPEDVL